jgi:OOP family OmpA-OmpF porin
MNRYKLGAASLLATLFATAIAHADDSGFYLGAAVGEATKSNSVFDDSDTAFKLLAGYSFNQYFAAEAGFVDAGKQKDSIEAFHIESATNGTFVAALAKLPIGKVVAPYVRVGYAYYETRQTVENGGVRSSESSSGHDAIYGGGLEFRLAEHLRIRAEYEKVNSDLTFDNYSVVFTYRF